MTELKQDPELVAALSGDHQAFEHLTEPFRRELFVHCYRMLGSFEDAEDVLQETFLRAWRKLNTYAGQAALRAWLYKIATNASLDALDKRRSRGLPQMLYPASRPGEPFPDAIREPVWLEPLPDEWIDERPAANPEARYEARESVTLAFLAALQTLPGRQRAVLLLRDVLGWNTAETAKILDMTEAAVNSALQRARAALQEPEDGRRPAARRPDNDQIASLLARYVKAWEMADAPALVALMREDIVLTMPPIPAWFQGRAAIQAFLEGFLFAGPAQGRFRLAPARANGGPAFAIYRQDGTGDWRPEALHVITLEYGQITAIHDFLTTDNKFFSRFGLPISG